MTTTTATKQINSWDWDVRVRERNIRKGVLNDKDIEKHLGQLADVEEQSESLELSQPALGPRQENI